MLCSCSLEQVDVIAFVGIVDYPFVDVHHLVPGCGIAVVVELAVGQLVHARQLRLLVVGLAGLVGLAVVAVALAVVERPSEVELESLVAFDGSGRRGLRGYSERAH